MPRRTIEQVQADEIAHDAVHSRLRAIRNLWYFANVYQFIFLFGTELKIDNEIDIDVFEEECLKPEPSHVLAEIGLCLLKWVSSHRGLTFEIFEEYTRRQYLAKAPELNPFGDEEEPSKFRDLDLFTKLKVLHQLSVWVFWNPDRMREKTHETDHTQWRMDPLGYDSKARAYYVLDDNRLYRMSFPTSRPPAAKKPQPKPTTTHVSRRSSKRQKLANGTSSGDAEAGVAEDQDDGFHPDESLGGAMWECLAVTLEEYQAVLDSLKKSKHPDEKDIVLSLREGALPELERAAESKKRKHAQRMRDMENMQRLATAKRSSRIAGKAEKQRFEDEQLAAEEKRVQDLAMAHAEQERQQKLDEARESRMQTREQRLKDREVRRILHEEELERLERGESIEGDGSRLSERNRKSQMEQKQRDLDALKRETVEDEWYFDCSGCGAVGKNFEDNKDAIACEKCGVWQHSACHGIKPEEASREDYQFICHHCANYPNGVRINVKQASKASKSPKGAKASRPASSSKSAKTQGADRIQKRGPGRPRKHPQADLAGDSTGSKTAAVQMALSSNAPGSSGNAFANGLPPQQSSHMPSGVHYPGTQPVWQTSAIQPQPQPQPLAPNPFPTAQPTVSGPSVNQTASFITDASAPGIHQHNSALSQTPVSKPNMQVQEKLMTPGQALSSLTPTFVHKDSSALSQATPGHTNPVDAPSSAASTRFAPSPQAGSNAAMSGKSPTKQDTPASSFNGGTLPFQQGSINATERPDGQQLRTPGKSGAPTLSQAPVLSPSVNAGPSNGQVPMKKPTPVKSSSVEVVSTALGGAAAPRPVLGTPRLDPAHD